MLSKLGKSLFVDVIFKKNGAQIDQGLVADASTAAVSTASRG